MYFLFASTRHQNDHKRSKAIIIDHWFSFPYLAIVSIFGSHLNLPLKLFKSICFQYL